MVEGAIAMKHGARCNWSNSQGAIAMKQGAKCNWSKLEIASGKLQEYKEGNTADYHQFRYFWNS